MTKRPTSLDEYIGQKNLKKELRLKIDSALSREARLDHVLLVGVPGCGKSTLAEIIANEMYSELETFIMPIDSKIVKALMFEYTGTVFLDEIHRMTAKQQEIFLPILWDGYMQTPSGERIENNEICWIGATTRGDKIDPAVRDRFRIKPSFDAYSDEDMREIVKSMASRENIDLSDSMAVELGKATLGAPRNAETIVGAIRDLKLRDGKLPTVAKVLSTLRLTPSGLTIEHVRYCEFLSRAGGQAGLSLMASLTSMAPGSVELLELDLIKQGFLERHNTGRQLTQKGY
jgi:Holliday junction DNA helicase RuvB